MAADRNRLGDGYFAAFKPLNRDGKIESFRKLMNMYNELADELNLLYSERKSINDFEAHVQQQLMGLNSVLARADFPERIRSIDELIPVIRAILWRLR